MRVHAFSPFKLPLRRQHCENITQTGSGKKIPRSTGLTWPFHNGKFRHFKPGTQIRVRRIIRIIVLLLILCPIARAGRDWKTYPAIVRTPQPPLLLALGDVHGDYDKLVELLAGSGIIKPSPARPQDVQWAAGKSVLVCTGDMIDKWNKGVEVLELMQALQISAEKSGGQVIVTLGNHEAEFLASGGGKKKAVEFTDELVAQKIDPAAVAAGTDSLGIGAWLRNRPVAAKVGEWFFCHAGNTFGMTVPALESQIENGVNTDGFGTTALSEPNSILEAKLNPVPWWITAPQSGASTQPTSGLSRLRDYAAALGCKHIVIGHQPEAVNFGNGLKRKAGTPFNYGGVFFLIDVGMSKGVQDSPGIILQIHDDEKSPAETIDAQGRISPLPQN